MTNPTQDWLSAGEAQALQGTVHAETGARYLDHDQGPDDDPTSYTEETSGQHHILRLLGKMVGGVVLPSSQGGTKVAVWGLPRYRIGATAYTLPGIDPFTCTDDATCYLYCDADEEVKEEIDDWPSGEHIKLAVVTTSGGTVSTITPALFENHLIGSDKEWFNFPAAGDVDLAGYDLLNVGALNFEEATDLTVASGVITPTQSVHLVSGQGGVDDDLDTITATADTIGRELILLPDLSLGEADGNVTLTENGNIELANGEFELSERVQTPIEHDVGYAIRLYQKDSTTWKELGRSKISINAIYEDVTVSGYGLWYLGALHFLSDYSTISSGSIDASVGTVKKIETEGLSASDDLDTITGGSENRYLIIRAFSASHTVVVKHGSGANKIALQNGLDFAMDTKEHTLMLRHNGTQWVEIARSPQRLRDLVTTDDEDRCIPYSPGGFFIPGALSAGVYAQEIYVDKAFTIKNITGRVPTAGMPSGGVCIIDLHDDGVSIFSNEGEMINIADGTQQDTSATKDHQVAAASILRIEVKSTSSSPNGADNCYVSINGYIGPQTAP